MLIIKIHSINILHLRMRYILRFRHSMHLRLHMLIIKIHSINMLHLRSQGAHADHQNTFNQYVTFANALHFKIPVTVCTSGCTC